MRHAILCFLLCATGVLVDACGGRDVSVTPSGAGGGTGRDAGVPDAATADAGYDPSAYCAAQEIITELPELIPVPRSILSWGDRKAPGSATLSFEGADAEEDAALREIAGRAGLTVTIGEGSVHVTLHPAGRWAPLAAACGLSAAETPGAYYLRTRFSGDRVTVDLFAAGDPGRFYARKTLAQIMIPAGPAIREAAIYDRPETAVRGVLEGFYGTPWGKEARLAMLGRLGDLKMNYYVYAPKNDVWITALWREDFPIEEVRHIRAVVEEARRHRVRACWELLPGGGIIFSRQEDFDQLMRKYRVIAAQGVDCFILAFDDVQKKLYAEDAAAYGSYVEGQVDFANRVGAALDAENPGALLGFVPVEYWSDHPDAATDLAWLGAHLDPRWAVAWTGRKVGSPTITAGDAAQIAGILGRPPFLGDNYPVSDNPQQSGVVNLGPLVGRDPALPAALSGFIFNAMPFPYASIPAVATGADFVWNPAAYDARRSLGQMARLVAGAAAAPALETLCLANRSMMLEPSTAPELDAAIAAFWTAWDGDGDIAPQSTALASQFFGPYTDLPVNLGGAAGARPLIDELMPWIDKLSTYGRAGGAALGLLAFARAGGTIDPAALAALERLAGDAASHHEKPTGASMEEFLAKSIAILKR